MTLADLLRELQRVAEHMFRDLGAEAPIHVAAIATDGTHFTIPYLFAQDRAYSSDLSGLEDMPGYIEDTGWAFILIEQRGTSMHGVLRGGVVYHSNWDRHTKDGSVVYEKP